MKRCNLGIVAHADAGKTTLTEQILYRCGAIRTLGSVDHGTASTDTMEIERRRGISVRAAGASVVFEGTALNLIDAPGHSDFFSEVERTLSVLDAAVLVVSAVEGVQPQTKLLLSAFQKAALPCVVFLNKCDRAGSNVARVLEELEQESGVPVLPIAKVQHQGEGEQTTVLAEDWADPDFQEQAVLALSAEDLMDELLAAGLSPQKLKARVCEKIAAADLLPVVCGCSKYGTGVDLLLQAVTTLLPAPEERPGDFCGRVYKIETDPALGKAAYTRIFCGSVRPRDTVRVGEDEYKITRVRTLHGRKLQDADVADSNEVAVLYGMPTLRAGDLIGTPCAGLREYHLTEPLMRCRVAPQQPEQLPQLRAALYQLEAEDPALQVEWNADKQELWLRLTGKIQIEVLGELLRERFLLAVQFGEASVIYRETPIQAAEGFEAYTMPKPCWAVVRFLIEPLPPGSGFQYECKVAPKRLPYRYQAHVETAVPRALTQGMHGWQVTDLKVTLLDGESHNEHTHPLDFFLATPIGIMDGLRNAGTKLLEPILAVELTAPEESLGRAIRLLTEHRAQFESPELRDGKFRLQAMLPAAESMDFPVEFAAATAGQGVYGARLSHYADCPPGLGKDRERVGVNPLDRSKFILTARSALATESDVRE